MTTSLPIPLRRLVQTSTGQVRLPFKLALFFVAVNAIGLGSDLLLRFVHLDPTMRPLPFKLQDVIIVLVATGVVLHFERRGFATVGMVPSIQSGKELMLGTLAGTAMALLAALPSILALGLGSRSQMGIFEALRTLAAFLGLAIFEEGVFRGYPFYRSVESLGPVWACGLVSIVFAGGHIVGRDLSASADLMVLVNGTLASLFACLSVLRTGRLAFAVGWHWSWNVALGPVLGFSVSGTRQLAVLARPPSSLPDWLSGGAFGPEAGVPCTLVTLGAVALWLAPRRSVGRGEAQ